MVASVLLARPFLLRMGRRLHQRASAALLVQASAAPVGWAACCPREPRGFVPSPRRGHASLCPPYADGPDFPYTASISISKPATTRAQLDGHLDKAGHSPATRFLHPE